MTESQELIIEKTMEFVKQELSNSEGGHDWWHIYRVLNTSIYIAKEESADVFVVQLAALLHDIADPKFHYGNEEIGPKLVYNFLIEIGVDMEIITHVIAIIRNMSFKNTFDNIEFNSLELDIVRDADRLDAIGAIGIARTFNYGGFIGSEIYNPNINPKTFKSKKEYKNSKAPTINHFYEKLLLLKSMMTTKTGKKLAENRHDFMETYLEQFYKEWNIVD